MCLKDKHYGPSAKENEVTKNLTISEGYKYLRILRLDKAISCFEAILATEPSNIRSLHGRAKCLMRLGRYQEAELDFQQVIKLNPKSTEAIYLKGVTDYLKGDFEKGFFTYWEGHKRLPTTDKLRHGYGMCETAIENTLNPDACLAITQKDIDVISSAFDEFQTKEEDTRDIEDYSKKGLFSADLKLLHDMLKDQNLTQHHPLCKDLFDYLRRRQKFWKMQDPRKTPSGSNCTIMKENALDLATVNRLVRNMNLSKMSLEKGKIENCIKKGLEALDIINGLSSEHFQEKDEIEREILHNIAMAYLVNKDFDSSLEYCEQQLNVARNRNILDGEKRALKDLGEVYMRKKSYNKALELFTECLRLAQTENSKSMLLYKISDCNVHLNHLENARRISNQCLEFASRTENARFKSDILLLLAEVAVKEKDMKEAEQFYKKALEIAVKENDPREKDLKSLMKLLETVVINDSCSNERFKILAFSNQMKRDIKQK